MLKLAVSESALAPVLQRRVGAHVVRRRLRYLRRDSQKMVRECRAAVESDRFLVRGVLYRSRRCVEMMQYKALDEIRHS